MESTEKNGYGGCLSALLPIWIIGQTFSLIQSVGFATFFSDLPLIPIIMIGSNIVAIIGIILLLEFKKIGFYIFILPYFLMALLGIVYFDIFGYGTILRSMLALALFLILMCFKNKDTKKNGFQTLGIIKTKSKDGDFFLNQNEDVKCVFAQHEQDGKNEITTEKVLLENTLLPISDYTNEENHNDEKNICETVCEKENIPNTEKNDVGETKSSNKNYSSIFKRPKLNNKYTKIVVLLSLGIIVLLLSISIYISINTYPSYISSFSDKWRYTFNMSNNQLGRELLNRVYSLKKNTYFVVDVPGFSISVVDSAHFFNLRDDVYREYPTSKTYIGNSQINDFSSLDSWKFYIIVPSSGEPYAYKGSELSSNNDRIVDAFSKTVYQTEEYDYEKEVKKEIQLLDEAAQIPLSDIKLISEIGSYYETLGIFSKAADYYKFELEHNNMPAIRGMLAYVLAKNGESTQAREHAEIVLEEEPKEINALSAMALLEADEYNWKEAKSFAKKAIDYGANDSYVYYAYCEALNKQGEIKASQKYYNMAYETNYWNPRREKYLEYAGCPFEILNIHYCSEKNDGTKIIPWDEKLVKNKCYYIGFKLDVNILRNEQVKVGIKLFENGRLESRINGYTYYDEIGGGDTGEKSIALGGWGSDSGNSWSSGSHKIEVWYKGMKIAEDTFYIY